MTKENYNVPVISTWPNWVIITGGLLMAILWPLYITLHGPTSFDQDGRFLGEGPLFWGMMMSAPARDEVDMDRLSSALLDVVGETMQPESVSLLIRQEKGRSL